MSPKRPMEIMQDDMDGPRQQKVPSNDSQKHLFPEDPTPHHNDNERTESQSQMEKREVRIVHLNFADGCCETEQAKSSSTALQFGAARLTSCKLHAFRGELGVRFSYQDSLPFMVLLAADGFWA